jgi:hypothetical protein
MYDLESMTTWGGRKNPGFGAANPSPTAGGSLVAQQSGSSPTSGRNGFISKIPFISDAWGGIKDWKGWDSAFGTEDALGNKTQGWAGPALQGADTLANLFMGMKQYGLAKDMFKQSKNEFNMNWDAQKQMTNAQLEDRQKARLAANPGGYQSVGDYMQNYGIR